MSWPLEMTRCGPWFELPAWKTEGLSEKEIQALYLFYGECLGRLKGVRQARLDPAHADTLETQYSDACMCLPDIDLAQWKVK